MARRGRSSLLVLGLFIACGDDSGSAGSTARSDAAVWSPTPPGSIPQSDASLVYTFPCLGERDATNEATFTSVYLDIFCKTSCTNPYCHGSSGAWGELDLSSSIEVAYENLVAHRTGTNVPADGRATCRESDLLRVVPGQPEQSLLYLKITGNTPCGVRMPPPDEDYSPLDPAQIEQIRRWIEAGAPLHSAPADAGFDSGSSDVDSGLDASP